MGTDIHAYIDVVCKNSDGKEYIDNFAAIDFGRNYWMFSLLAGVRIDPEKLDGKPLLVEPRSAPKNNSYQFESEYTLFITDHVDDDDRGYCTKEQAESWGNDWYDDEHKRIVGPDWHSASYLYADELEIIQERYSKLMQEPETLWLKPNDPIPEGFVFVETFGEVKVVKAIESKPVGRYVVLDGVISAMKAMNGDDPKRTRFVFFFDN